MTRRLLAAVFLMMTLTLAVACTTPNVIYSQYQLEYDLLYQVGHIPNHPLQRQ